MADRDSFEQSPYELPPGSTEVVLVRHGASEAAVVGSKFPLVDGHSNPALSGPGRAQAAMVAERLAAEEIGGLFVSTLRRTEETAAPLAEAIDLEPQALRELREVYLGDFEGGEYRVRSGRGDPVIKQVFEEERWDAIPNGESWEDFGARVSAGVERIVERVGPNSTAVAVVHGAVIGQLCRQATDSRPFAFVHSDNGSISRLVVFDDGRWLLRSFNDISHLYVKTGPAG
ncbi:MAG: 2,3-bisphosphoglycerate-dependent phosphoglycerate mutase [Solirubrobacterales bacterium]|jgi:probable phosphoglycerate mutase|nr:2,3-bisphosphoglycerate-dependent phosphoglycerate mutase [Solirubrobacterales bacterium]